MIPSASAFDGHCTSRVLPVFAVFLVFVFSEATFASARDPDLDFYLVTANTPTFLLLLLLL